MRNQSIGLIGEYIAIDYLKNKRFQILHHHFTSHWGELDVVAKKGRKIFFIEVKTRIGEVKGKPYEAVSFYKLRSLKRTIQKYLMQFHFPGYKYSLDIISITLDSGLTLRCLKYFTIYE